MNYFTLLICLKNSSFIFNQIFGNETKLLRMQKEKGRKKATTKENGTVPPNLSSTFWYSEEYTVNLNLNMNQKFEYY